MKVVELLRARPKTQGIPILVHTGSQLSDSEKERLASQVEAISSKAEPSTLLANLERLEFLHPRTLRTG